MTDDMEEYRDYVMDGVAVYRMSLRDLRGSLARVVPVLAAVLAIDPNAEFDVGWGDDDGSVDWRRKLSAEEIAEREREEREEDERREADRIAKERSEFERLSAKYGNSSEAKGRRRQ